MNEPRTPYGDPAAAERRAREERPPWLSSEPPESVRRIKHCWLLVDEERLPGLVVKWRRGDAGLEAWAIVPRLVDGKWIPHQAWLPAELVESLG